MSLSEAFSYDAVVQELCKARIKLAQRRRQNLFFHNICQASQGPQETKPLDWGEIDIDIFPPRRHWNRFRHRHRHRQSSDRLGLKTLLTAITHFKRTTPTPSWLVALNETVDRIRARALGSGFVFQPPEVRFAPKDQARIGYRAIAQFPLEDRIIDSLTARYLRETLDIALLPSCIAFRACTPALTIHSALTQILAARDKWSDQQLYVAECDIKGFFDCVSHETAKNAVQNLIYDAQAVDPTIMIDAQAIRIFSAFLNSYCFQDSVLRLPSEPGLVAVTKKWPRNELESLHRTEDLPRIGLPQGGALSGFAANALLHSADKALESDRSQGKVVYLRYCDDMILISPSSEQSRKSFDLYQQELEAIRLPAHIPARVDPYKSRKSRLRFWSGKSKLPYLWDSTPNQPGVPWIQFVGYQVRRDGMIRIRKASINKERRKITQVADRLLRNISGRNDGRSIVRRTRGEILHRLRQRLIAMSVGHAKIWGSMNETLPMCWTNGFRGLIGKKSVVSGIKALDRHREAEIKRVERRLQTIRTPRGQKKQSTKTHRYYGSPFSYAGRFVSKSDPDKDS